MNRTLPLIGALVVVSLVGLGAQTPFGPPVERKILSQFDANQDSRLDAAERKAARAWLAANPAQCVFPGGRCGGFGGRGNAVAPAPGRPVAPADAASGGKAPLYDTATLRTVFLQFEGPDWEQELGDFHNTDVEVPAVVTVDGKTYRDVGVHFRGMSSFMMVGAGQKRSLNLSFDFVNDDQRLLGARTQNLLNANGDATFVRPVLYAAIANRYIPAPKANFVRVVINGESWGVYINAEQFNSDFTRDRFGSAKGARWKVPGSPMGGGGLTYLGEDAEAYRRLYEIKSKDDAASWAQLATLTRVLNQTPVETLESALAPILDIDGALRFLALDVALVNSDGYWSRASDYSLYQDETGRFHVIPHDMNEGLMDEGGRGRGGPGRGGPGGGGRGRGLPPGFDPGAFFGPQGGFPPGGFPPGGFPGGPGRGGVDLDPLVGLDRTDMPLRSKLLAVPALRARYLTYVRDIAEQWLDWNRLGPIVAAYRALIEAEVRADTRKLFTTEAFEAGLATGEESLRHFVDERRAFLLKSIPR